MRSVKYWMMISVCLLLLNATPCLAELIQSRQILPFDLDNITYTEYAPLRYPPYPVHIQTQALQFNAFDPSLGTLKNAYVSYEGTYAIEYMVAAGVRPLTWWEDFWDGTYWGNVSGWAAYEYSLNLLADGTGSPLKSVIQSHYMTTEIHGTVWAEWDLGMYWYNIDGSGPKDIPGDGTPDGTYRFQPWVTSGDLDVPLLGLSDGLDVFDGVFDVILEKEISLFMLPFFSSFVDPEYSYVKNYLNKWYGNVALTYEYEPFGPVPTPELGVLLLLCTGLIGLMGVRRSGK